MTTDYTKTRQKGEIKNKRGQSKVREGVWNKDGRKRFKQFKNAEPHLKKLEKARKNFLKYITENYKERPKK